MRLFRISLLFGLLVLIGLIFFFHQVRGSDHRTEVDLSGPGWNLWWDDAAAWQTEAIFPPGTDLTSIPSHPPTGGWEQLQNQSVTPVSVPGTVEQYLYHWNPAKPETKHSQGMTGVSWWFRTLPIPSDLAGKTVLLQFESTRFRAEVYLNQKLVGYNLVEGTPFTVNLTGLVQPGEQAQLAVRITNPGGWWSWEDCNIIPWGNRNIPLSRGFGGITGSVVLQVLNPVHLDDIYVQNTPEPHAVNVEVTVQNDGVTSGAADLQLKLVEKNDPTQIVAQKLLTGLTFPPGSSKQTVALAAPQAKLWDLDHPNLYRCEVTLQDSQGKVLQARSQTFGFRWFAPEGLGTNAVLRLNGKRIVLRTAISWGFWGNTGLVPSPEMAARQIDDAKLFGLNMLNFHRAVGQTSVLDLADEKGLLYFEEPGSYVTGSADPFCEQLVREKLMRMVKRDRSHPSLVIYNMINEQWTKFHADTDDKLYATFQQDMAAAHQIDPSRVIVLSSAWSRAAANTPEKNKLNMRPYDNQEYQTGWWDFHRASGPESWKESFYQGPDKHYGFTANDKEIVYWGEEGAISSPPRVELIKKDLQSLPNKGWDGDIYLDWDKKFVDYLTEKNLRTAFPTVDDFTVALSAVAMEHQGRKIEDTRICNLNDGYAINGWEAEPYENHSGVVDCYRHPKGDPALISYYNQPLYVAVKTRNQVLAAGNPATVDYYLINEKNLAGNYLLKVSALRADGQVAFQKDYPVTVTGGETYGQLLTEGVTVPTTSDSPGLWTLQAQLVDGSGQEITSGHDKILVVDWKSAALNGDGAIYEVGTKVHDFLKTQKNLEVHAYQDGLGPLKWILVARTLKDLPQPIPPECFLTSSGGKPGLNLTVYRKANFTEVAAQRVVPQAMVTWSDGASPDPSISAGAELSEGWKGSLIPPTTGNYSFLAQTISGSAQLKLNGKLVNKNQSIPLTAGQPVLLELTYVPKGTKGGVTLQWLAPQLKPIDATALLQRAQKDGTTVILADGADTWMDLVKTTTPITYQGSFKIGQSWLGGQYFTIQHPLFKDLPINQALNWPYQAVISGTTRLGLRVEGEQLVAGCWQSYPFDLGTAVGIIPRGQGQVIFSTLDICPHLSDPPGPADLARKLLCNYLQYAAPAR